MPRPRGLGASTAPVAGWWSVRAHEGERSVAMMATGIGLLVLTVLLLPVQQIDLPRSAAFLPAATVGIVLLFGLTAYLLIGDFLLHGDVRLLTTAAGYLASVVLMVFAGLATPGAFVQESPIGSPTGLPSALFTAACLTLALTLALAWAPWPPSVPVSVRGGIRALTALTACGGAALLAGAIGSVLVIAADGVDGWGDQQTARIASGVVVVLLMAALVITLRGTIRRSGPERWLSLVSFACLGGVALGIGVSSGDSVGWYAGRALILLGAVVMLLAWAADARRIKIQAEHDAAFDQLTGLPNRRSGLRTLEQTLARCRRAGSPLAVLLLDLDGFREINERHGYEAGDATLTAVARQIVGACRTGDVVARVGGEEFLVLLPDTKDRGALIVADKVRSAVALEPLEPIGTPLTASIGLTTLQIHDLDPNEMLVRARTALARAKQSGRNRIVLVAGLTDDDLLGAL
jgi:diguanylate cyclase (GGDEF)-like protein